MLSYYTQNLETFDKILIPFLDYFVKTLTSLNVYILGAYSPCSYRMRNNGSLTRL